MPTRTLRLQMKKGLAIVKETQEIPLKENKLLHTNEYTFFCNPTTFDKLARYKAIEDKADANKKLEEFFLKEAQATNIQQFCFDITKAITEVKTDLLIGEKKKLNYHDIWEKETSQAIKNALSQGELARKVAGKGELELYSDPNNFYKAMVDMDAESIEFIQFEEAMSTVKQKNVIAEHLNIHRRPMYIVDRILSLIMFIRDDTGNRNWGE